VSYCCCCCQAFLDVHSTAVAAEGLSPTKASVDDGLGGAKLAARLSPLKDADSSQVRAMQPTAQHLYYIM
jgi:hypothetical protein